MSRRIAIVISIALLPIVLNCSGGGSTGLTITSFDPTVGAIGSEVKIYGSGFGATAADNKIWLEGTACTCLGADPSELKVRIMPGSVTGKFKVEAGGYGDTSTGTFTVVEPPTIDDFGPKEGWEGTRLTIKGKNFSTDRASNTVRIGGVPAFVIGATATELDVLVGFKPMSGPVEVEVYGIPVASADAFKVLPWPTMGSGDDGPPIFFEGAGAGSAGDLPSTGTMRVLVSLGYPSDQVPSDMTGERNDIVDVWDDVETFYDQSSYSQLNVNPDITTWHALSDVWNDYYSASHNNIDPAVLDQLVAECAQGAVNQGFDLDDYDAMACYIFANGTFLRAWGGWSKQNFSYSDGGSVNINLTADSQIHLMAMGERANWGRCAHEIGHNLVSAGAVLGEDVYRSDLIDPDQATAAAFDMMGSHDDHPNYSAQYMRYLDWYDPANIADRQWDRNPFSETFQVAEHGLTEDGSGSVVHVVRIQVTEGLAYYIECRRRPTGGSAQIFDTSIPLSGAPNNGGVIVTKVLSDVVNNNQQTRFITLLHDERVLVPGDVATDPLRALEITVDSESTASGRLISTVTVEWAQDLTPDPTADFNLRITPWGAGYETVDIWVDRQPWGVFDHSDGGGNPIGNGDKPQVMAINRFTARGHCEGSSDATNVRMTFYSVTPPGVGDNGNWTPLQTIVVPTILGGGDEVEYVNWIPTVGDHTCLKVYLEDQAGENTYGDNQAQENIFEFEPAADSPPDPQIIPLAIRNPREEAAIVLVRMVGIPEHWTVHLPHHWVYLPGRGEAIVEAVVFTDQDIGLFEQKEGVTLNMLVDGRVPTTYTEMIDEKYYPASCMRYIGGITAMVNPKRRGELDLQEDEKYRDDPDRVGVRGMLTPARANQPVEVTMRDPDQQEQHVTAMTSSDGSFSAVFNLKQDESKPGTEPSGGTHGTAEFRVQAFIVNAPLVAETQSNVVYIVKGSSAQKR